MSLRSSFLQQLQKSGRWFAEKAGRDSLPARLMRPAYEWLLVQSSRNQGMPYVMNGNAFRIDPLSRSHFSENYESNVAEFIRKRVQKNSICLNVGANIGIYVLQFCKWSEPDGRVIAFEPNPQAREILNKHIAWNGFHHRVTVEPFAVGDSVGQGTLFAAGADGMSRLAEANVAIADRVSPVPVQVVTLDDYCKRNSLIPDWIIMDIEGFEIAALNGAKEMIRKAPNLNMVVEMHPNVWNSANSNPETAKALIQDLNFEMIPLSGQDDPWNQHGNVYLKRKS